jgi:hypothetical protein
MCLRHERPVALGTVNGTGGSFAVQGPIRRWDRVATLEEAKAESQKSWDEWKPGRSWKRWNDPACPARGPLGPVPASLVAAVGTIGGGVHQVQIKPYKKQHS